MAEENKETKKPLIYRLFKDVVKADSKTVISRVWSDAIAPGMQRELKQIMNTAIDTAFARQPSNTTVTGNQSKSPSFYNNLTKSGGSVAPKPVTDFTSLRYPTREKAEEILQMMQFSIQATGRYRLDDFFIASGSKAPDWTYQSYGWSNLEAVQAAYVEKDPNTDLFLIRNLAKPIPLR